MNKQEERERNLEIAVAKLEAIVEHIASEKDLVGDGQAVVGEALLKVNEEQKKKLKGFLSEAIASLQTIADERDHYNDIIDTCVKELGVNKKSFKKTATLVHKGKLEEEIKIMEEADEVYTLVSEVL